MKNAYLAKLSTEFRTVSTTFCFVSRPGFLSTLVKEIFLSRFDLGIFGSEIYIYYLFTQT